MKALLPVRELTVGFPHPLQGRYVAGVVLSLLGPPSVGLTEGGPILPQPGAKALALLTYLVLEPGPHTREELAGLLWGESSETEARTSLRQALKHLRNALGEIIQSDRGAIRVAGLIECEARDFRSRVEQEPGRALNVDITRFLAGFSVRHAPVFEEWVAATRRDLLHRYGHALGTLTREAMGQCRWRDALELSDRWLRCDPLSDEAARLSIEARYLSGDRGAALARFTEYRATLLRETGYEPSRSLFSLARRVETDAAPISGRPITDEWYARAPSFEASLIGRQEEWGELVKAWKAVRRGAGRIVLIEGEAGVGKSRLAAEFLRWAVADGGTVLRGHGYDVRAGVPYEPLVEVLREALIAPGIAATSPEWLTEVTRLLPELRQRFPSLPQPVAATDAAESWRLFEGVSQLVVALAAERPLVISIDDLHWCDGDSCNLLRFLVRRTEQAPILWLGTICVGEVEREAAAARLCRVLRAKSHARVFCLGPLSEDELWRMIREMGHVSTPTGARRFASRIFGVTGGNPFYVIELLKTMFAQGFLAVQEGSGEWTATADAGAEQGRELPVSQTVQDVIAERVERLPDELCEVLVTIAVASTGCRTGVLSHVHGISRLHAAAVGDALVERRLVVQEEGVYRCAHPVIAQVVRAGLTASRRQEVHRSLALSLERIMPPEDGREVAREIARHADRGEEPALAYRFALVATDEAVERYAFAEALSWLDLAAGNARGPSETDMVNRRTAEVLEAAGWSEVPPLTKLGGPITRDLDREDFDLPVRG